MTTQNQQKPCYITLEVHPPSTLMGSLEPPKRFMQLKSITQKLINWLFTKPELTVKQKVDCFDNVIWCVYDPASEQTVYLGSEEEARIWIEEAFHYSRVINSSISNELYWHQSRLLR